MLGGPVWTVPRITLSHTKVRVVTFSPRRRHSCRPDEGSVSSSYRVWESNQLNVDRNQERMASFTVWNAFQFSLVTTDFPACKLSKKRKGWKLSWSISSSPYMSPISVLFGLVENNFPVEKTDIVEEMLMHPHTLGTVAVKQQPYSHVKMRSINVKDRFFHHSSIHFSKGMTEKSHSNPWSTGE